MELDFYQIKPPIPAPPTPESPPKASFVRNEGFLMESKNTKITRLANGSYAIRLDRALDPELRYKWTIKIEHIVDSHWIAVGVAYSDAKNCDSMWGISSNNEVYTNKFCSTALTCHWHTGDLIHVTFQNSRVIVTNERTTYNNVKVNANGILYPFFDVSVKDVSISLVDFECY